MTQMELFTQPEIIEASTPTPDSVRARFDGLLIKLRGAKKMPLSPKELAFWRVVTPQMANWLPSEERDNVARAVTAEIERLSA